MGPYPSEPGVGDTPETQTCVTLNPTGVRRVPPGLGVGLAGILPTSG